MKRLTVVLAVLAASCAVEPPIQDGPAPVTLTDAEGKTVTLKAGHASLQRWLLPAVIPAPESNKMTPERVALGEKLFFDPRLSVSGQTSCASCHAPERGWADGLPLSMRLMGERMTRNSQTVVNVGFVSLLGWDGKSTSLEQQALNSQNMTGSLGAGSKEQGHTNDKLGIERIGKLPGYVDAFAKAYPGEAISKETAAKAIAAFERSLVSRNTPFDRWVRGDAAAMTPAQVSGFQVFVDPNKGNCAACHSAPNFTDNGFHNIGLKQWAEPKADAGRYKIKAVASMKGAFRTPTLREVGQSAPYFHDGSAPRMQDVVDHYIRGGDVHSNLSPSLKPLTLSAQERADLLAFMQALDTPYVPYDAPRLPR
jgi:cytochrome c peroxidase